jgi:beta-glucosidase
VYYNHPFGSSWHQGDSIGFPDYVDAPHTPRYHFGHGLSYTSFEYSRLTTSAPEVRGTDTLTVTLKVRNSGEREGTETVQLYVRDRFASVTRPVQELAGFRRVFLAAGEAADVEFRLDLTELAFLDVDMHWRVEEGDVDLLIGSSSEDIRLRGVVRITDTSEIIGRDRAFFAASTHRRAGANEEG